MNIRLIKYYTIEIYWKSRHRVLLYGFNIRVLTMLKIRSKLRNVLEYWDASNETLAGISEWNNAIVIIKNLIKQIYQQSRNPKRKLVKIQGISWGSIQSKTRGEEMWECPHASSKVQNGAAAEWMGPDIFQEKVAQNFSKLMKDF